MVAETANGCLVLHIARTIAERHNREPENLKRLLCALLRSASGELFALLTKTYHGRRLHGSSGAATQTPHLFPASIADGRRINLVDPNKHNKKDLYSGLLSVSEIGFDDTHQFAVFTFTLVRSGRKGSLYRRGGTLVLRKTNGKWARANETCLDWMT